MKHAEQIAGRKHGLQPPWGVTDSNLCIPRLSRANGSLTPSRIGFALPSSGYLFRMAKKPNRERTDSQVKLNQTKCEANCVSTEPAFQKKHGAEPRLKSQKYFWQKIKAKKQRRKKRSELRREGRVPQLSWTCNSSMTLTWTRPLPTMLWLPQCCRFSWLYWASSPALELQPRAWV